MLSWQVEKFSPNIFIRNFPSEISKFQTEIQIKFHQKIHKHTSQKNSRRLWRSQRRKSSSVPAGAANFPAAVFLAGKCPNLGRDSISRCPKIGDSFSSSVEICRKTLPRKDPEGKNAKGKTSENFAEEKMFAEDISEDFSDLSLLLDFIVFLDIFEIFAEDCFLPISFRKFLPSGFLPLSCFQLPAGNFGQPQPSRVFWTSAGLAALTFEASKLVSAKILVLKHCLPFQGKSLQ